MKPALLDDFFRRPAPPGRSRESSIVLDEGGCFWHDGQRIEHRGVAHAFARWLDIHPDDGRYILNNGYDWTYVTVRGVPFVINNLHWGHSVGGEHLEATLSDGSQQVLDPEQLWLTPASELRARVKGGRFVARLSTPAQVALSRAIEEREGGYYLWVGGREYRLPVRDE